MPDVVELAENVDALMEAVAELSELPKLWRDTVQDLDDQLERLEVRRKRIAATESRLRAREQREASGDGDDAQYASDLARAHAASMRMGLMKHGS